MSGAIVRVAGMRWSELAAAEPVLGAIAHEKLIEPGVLLIGTVRRSGIARISGVEPLVMDDDLWLSMMPQSTKALDLARDRRIVLNSVVAGPEPAIEIKVVGQAEEERAVAVQEKYAAAVAEQLGWRPVVGRFTLFRMEIDEFTYIGYDEQTRGQHIAQWPAGVEYIRPATSPTSLGPKTAVRRILRA
jgi:hypothetical protein